MHVQWTLLLLGLFAGIGLACLGIAALSELTGKFKEIKLSLIVSSFILLVLGGIASFFHLNHPQNVFYVLGNISSGISIELILVGLSAVVIVALYYFNKKRGSRTVKKIFAVLGLILSVLLPFATGEAYFVMTARPAWSTIFLPILYVVAAWSGALVWAFVLQAQKAQNYESLKFFARLSLIGIAAFVVAVALYLVGVATADHQDYSRSAAIVLTGEYAPIFWGLTMLFGVFIPLVLLFVAYKKIMKANEDVKLSSRPALFLAAISFVSFLVGSTGIRVLVYLLGTSVHAYIYS